MALPVLSPDSAMVEFHDGQKIEVFGLTRSAALKMADHQDDLGLTEKTLLVAGLRLPMEEVTPWYEATSSAEVEKVVKAILKLSGLDVDPLVNQTDTSTK